MTPGPATVIEFDTAWTRLQETVKHLSSRDLTDVRDPAGWAVKDHLIHVALWERALLASVDGRARHEALGIDASSDGSEDWDGINAQIFAANRHRALDDVLKTLGSTHETTRARLSAAVSGGASVPSPADDKLLADIPGYIEHYDQHRGWIVELVGSG
jgi:hypothetical protein